MGASFLILKYFYGLFAMDNAQKQQSAKANYRWPPACSTKFKLTLYAASFF